MCKTCDGPPAPPAKRTVGFRTLRDGPNAGRLLTPRDRREQ